MIWVLNPLSLGWGSPAVFRQRTGECPVRTDNTAALKFQSWVRNIGTETHPEGRDETGDIGLEPRDDRFESRRSPHFQA